MILVILAAGQGSRLKAKTKNTPKCLIKIDKKSIVDYIYPFIKKFNKTIIVSGYKSKLIEQKLRFIVLHISFCMSIQIVRLFMRLNTLKHFVIFTTDRCVQICQGYYFCFIFLILVLFLFKASASSFCTC